MNVRAPRLETERLWLRALKSEDFKVYQRFFADEQASVFYGGPLPARLAWRKFVEDYRQWALRGCGVWALEIKETDQMIGVCGLYWPEDWPQSKLDWWIVPEARGHGYTLEVTSAVSNYAYETRLWD